MLKVDISTQLITIISPSVGFRPLAMSTVWFASKPYHLHVHSGKEQFQGMNYLTSFSCLLQERHSALKSQHQHQRHIWLAITAVYGKSLHLDQERHLLTVGLFHGLYWTSGLFHAIKRERSRLTESLPMPNCFKKFQVQVQSCCHDFKDVSPCHGVVFHTRSEHLLQSTTITGDFPSYGGDVKRNGSI